MIEDYWRHVRALATDYDGTLAGGSDAPPLMRGRVPEVAIDALRNLRRSGRRSLLVTGRRLPDLKSVFSDGLALFDIIVAENGALLYWPESRRIRALADAPPPELLNALKHRGVKPLDIGHVIVATVTPHDREAREVLAELGLKWRVIMNRDSAMLLPEGVHKASGLQAALRELGISPSDTGAIGDAENDRDLLASVGARAAVANAIDLIKELADVVTELPDGAGVAELVTGITRAA